MSDQSKGYHDRQWAIYKDRILELLKRYTPDLRNTTGTLPVNQVPSGIPGTRLGAGTVTPAELSFDPATQTELNSEAATRAAADSALSAADSAHAALTTSAHGGIVASADPRLTDARTPLAHDIGGALHTGTLSDALHGARAGGTLHPAVVAAGAAGFMSGADKTKLDGVATGAQTGTVTSVALTAPSFLSVAGTPITGAGTLALTLAVQAANRVLVGPSSGASAVPTFRTLVQADLPIMDMAQAGAGQLAVLYGGTGTSLSASGGANQIVKQSSVGGALTVSALVAADLPNHSAALLTSGLLALARGGSNADLSATGGANQVVRQSSVGGALSVSALAAADIPALDAAKITTGLLPVARGGTGVAAIPAFFVHKNGTGQTGIVTATHTLVTWSTETVDNNNNFASNRFTPTIAGTYLITLVLYWDVMADQAYMIPEIYKNGVLIAGTASRASGIVDQGSATVAIVVMNGSTDYLDAYAYQSTGSNKTINGNATATYFGGAWIGP